MSETPQHTPEHRGASVEALSNIEILRQMGWSPVTSGQEIRARNDHRVEQLSRRPATDREKFSNVVNIAYYALELSTSLIPPSQIGQQQESQSDEQAIARAVALELIDLNKVYASIREVRTAGNNRRLWELQRRIKQTTEKFTPANTDCLRALALMSRHNVSHPSLPRTPSHDAEHLLRMLIAEEQGFVQNWAF